MLKRSLKKLEELDINLNDCIIGFLDETSPQLNANTQRLWSFDKPSVKKNTTRLKANTFGFYAVNGKSVVDFKENSKKESVCEFLEEIRAKNPDKTIIVVLDNFRSHWAKKTRRKAKKLNIILNSCLSASLFSRSESHRADLEGYKENPITSAPQNVR